MENKIRVLIADDSPSFRAGLVLALEEDPEIRVVGQAGDGHEAVSLAAQLKPDVVTMDVVMPALDGIAASQAILTERQVPILLLTTLARSDEQRMALNAMRLGVLDILNKPVLVGEKRSADLAGIVHLVKVATRVKLSRAGMRPQASSDGLRPRYPPRLIAIVASTGGPPAVETLVRDLPANSPPVIIAQHLPAAFARSFAQWLTDAAKRPVAVVTEKGELLTSGHLYIAADGLDIKVHGDSIAGEAASPGRAAPSADILFSSVANAFGSSALGIVLTGMGRDGAIGLGRLKAAGGWTIAQDESSSVVFNMPEAAAQAGACCEVLALEKIASSLVRILDGPSKSRGT